MWRVPVYPRDGAPVRAHLYPKHIPAFIAQVSFCRFSHKAPTRGATPQDKRCGHCLKIKRHEAKSAQA